MSFIFISFPKSTAFGKVAFGYSMDCTRKLLLATQWTAQAKCSPIFTVHK